VVVVVVVMIAVADNATAVTLVAVVAVVLFLQSAGYYRSLCRYQDSTATLLYHTPTIDVCSQFAQFLRPSSAPTRSGDAHSIYSTLVSLVARFANRVPSTIRTRTPYVLADVATATIAATFVTVAIATDGNDDVRDSVNSIGIGGGRTGGSSAATASDDSSNVLVAATAVSSLVSAPRAPTSPPS